MVIRAFSRFASVFHSARGHLLFLAALSLHAMANDPLDVARSLLEKRDLVAAKSECRRVMASDGANVQAKWEAEALDSALEILPRITRKHPRLFVNEASWPAVKLRALGAEKELFSQMTRRLDNQALDKITGRSFAMEAMEAAFVQRVGEDKGGLEKLRRMLRVSVDVIPQRREGASERSFPAIACAAALDWTWDDLPADERRTISAGLLADAWKRSEEARAAGKLAEWPHYYVRSQFWFVGVALLDESLDDISFARAVSLMGIGLKNYRERIASLLATAGADGVWQTNPEYDFGSVPSPMFAFFYSWKTATGLELPAEWRVAGVAPEFALRTFPAMENGRLRHFNYAGHSNGAWGLGEMRPDLLPEFLADHVHFFGKVDPQGAAIAQFLRRRIAGIGGLKVLGEIPVLRFLQTGAPDVSQFAPLAPLPLARNFASVGLVMMSSGFDAGDTFALYSQGGGVRGRRHDFDATHFSIYKRGHLAVDTGARFAAEHSANYRHQTVAHNAVLIQMPGEKFIASQTGPVTANGGGQYRYPENATPLAFESHREFAYAATDATPVYRSEKCEQMTRQFVFLPPEHFVVFDRVVSKRADFQKSWLLHTGNEPQVAGREFRADNEGGRLFCRTLYPVDAVLEKVGGQGREFWSDGRNWPVEDFWQRPGARDWWKLYGKGLMEPPSAMGRWRVEVKPGTARAEDCFLHLLQASSVATAAMGVSPMRESAQEIEVSFSAGKRTWTLVFNKSGEVGGRIRIADSGKIVVIQSLARNVQ